MRVKGKKGQCLRENALNLGIIDTVTSRRRKKRDGLPSIPPLTLSPPISESPPPPDVLAELSAFHWMLFFDFFSISPMPSSTLVMSYIRRFCTCNDSAARFKSIVPSSACSINVTNFFVNRLNEL